MCIRDRFRIDAIINIKKDTSFPSFPPDGDDGLASCVKMVEEVQGVGALLEDLKHATFEKWEDVYKRQYWMISLYKIRSKSKLKDLLHTLQKLLSSAIIREEFEKI